MEGKNCVILVHVRDRFFVFVVIGRSDYFASVDTATTGQLFFSFFNF